MCPKIRNSNLELLRLLCIFGIVIMHTCGPIMEQATGTNMLWIQLENGLFQAGVSIFILISGFFGIRTSVERVLKLEIKVWIYSVLSGVVIYLIIDNSIMRLVKSALPIITNKYWFLTGYMLLMLFAPFLNCAVEQISQKYFRQLLLIMFVVFFFIPTVLYFDVLGDNGKNVINIVFMYLLGAYLRKYPEDTFEKKYWFTFIVSFLVSFILNIGISIVTKNMHCPMSRDCSVFIVFEAVAIFMIFKDLNIKSLVINSLAKHVIAVYMLESLIRKLIELYLFDYTKFYGSDYWFIINIVLALVTVFVCIIIDYLRDIMLSNIETKLIKKIEQNIWVNVFCKHFFLKNAD